MTNADVRPVCYAWAATSESLPNDLTGSLLRFAHKCQ